MNSFEQIIQYDIKNHSNKKEKYFEFVLKNVRLNSELTRTIYTKRRYVLDLRSSKFGV